MAQGENRFELLLTTETDTCELMKRAVELACPPDKILGTYHTGPLSEADEGICVSAGVMVDAIKKSEDGTGWIVRAREAKGEAIHAKIELKKLNRTIEAAFTPWQIRTFLLTEKEMIDVDFTETAK